MNQHATAKQTEQQGMSKKTSRLVMLATIIILVAAFLAWKLIISSAPVPKRGVAKEIVRLVDAVPLQRAATRPVVLAGGEVQASDAVELQAEVSGRVVWLAPAAEPGAQLSKGDLLARIDDTDYVLAVKQAEASLAQAKAELAVEQGQVALAQEEYELAGLDLQESDRALVLREPQRQVAEAAVAAAQASLNQARANLTRTEIRMPFDGRIIERNVSPGSQSSSVSSLFSVVGTGSFYIEVKVPRSFLPFLDMSQSAEVAPRNSADEGSYRQARLLHILPQVDSADRQVRIVLAVDDPMNAQAGPIILVNDYVQVRLSGREIKDTYVVPRRYLNSDNTVWVVNDSALALRSVKPVYAGRDNVWIESGFEEGDMLLESQIDTAVDGMKVRVAASGEAS